MLFHMTSTTDLVAVPFRHDTSRAGWTAKCPDCGTELAFMSDEYVTQVRDGRPPVFGRGYHTCTTY